MTHYTHLTQEQKYQISALLQANKSISEIARIIGCHTSTVSREIRHNRGRRGYRPKQANQLAKSRKANNSAKITSFGWSYIEYLLNKHYSVGKTFQAMNRYTDTSTRLSGQVANYTKR